MNPYKEIEESSFAAGPHLNYDDIATKLLKDHYFLTALELHTELVESGRELPQLREFFSNPGNFEQHVSRASEYNSMHRTPSLATLDSLDTARYSEDGGGDRGGSGGDVAVLEFELRKAKETINSLRANLTQFADGESALDSNVKDKFGQRSLKPHEKRALNFLVNEYLLLQDYKLTSITFSDENPDQDFEDWDDVGLNMPRPSGLVSLFRGDSTKSNNATSDAATEMDVQCDSEAECQTDITEESNACVSCQTTIDDTDWNHEMLIQAEEIELLKQKIIALETDKLNFQKLYDAAIVSLNSLTSPGAEGKGIELNISQNKLERVVLEEPLPSTATENHYGSSNSAHSVTPEQFEMIDSEKTVSRPKIEGSNASSFDPATLGESSVRDSPQRRSSVATLDETLSINDGGEWTRVQSDFNSMEISSKEMWIDSGLPNSLKVSILNWCCETLNINEPIANDLLAELVSRDEPITIEDLLVLVADTLPMIIPHTLVSRRCEAVALLASSIHLLEANESTRRSKLLQLLLSLLKKPAAAETRLICEAACLIVKWGGSGDVLSSIADLLTSRSSERRILASQICVSIAPYVSIELCTSLLLSLVILMCESSETEIRSLGLKAACLICPVAEHKYSQLEGILFNFLRDPVEKNVKDTVAIFVPVMARSALIAGKFTDFTSRILTNLEKSSTDKDNTNTLLHLDIMRVLVLAKLAYVVNVQIVKDYNYNNCDIDTVNYQEVPLEGYQEHFIDAQCYVDNIDVRAMLVAMNSLIKEKPDVRWSETNWFISIVKQILELSISSRSLNQASIYLLLISLFSSYVENFGPHFTFAILRPVFCDIIGDIEQRLEKIHAVNVDCMVAVGIYLVTVLPSIADAEETGAFLQKWVMYSSIRGLPIKIFSVPFKWAATHRPELLNSFMQQLREFSASSCDSASGATIREYIANLITELLNVADVTPHCVETQLLPAVVALLHDDDVSVRSSALTAWGGVTHRCVTRSLPSETRCWEALRQALERGGQGDTAPRGARETARAAEALALLILPDADSDEVNDEAVSMLCALCESAPLSAECMSALAPGLQLAAHHAANHRATLPALRKLEERMQAAQLTQYKASIEALIHNVAGTSTTAPDVSSRDMTKGDVTRAAKSDVTRHAAANLQAAQEAVGRRVTQMFQQSKTNMNLQNIFKKKT